jgi:hypothetical protein
MMLNRIKPAAESALFYSDQISSEELMSLCTRAKTASEQALGKTASLKRLDPLDNGYAYSVQRASEIAKMYDKLQEITSALAHAMSSDVYWAEYRKKNTNSVDESGKTGQSPGC